MKERYKMELINRSTGKIYNQTFVTCHQYRMRNFARALVQDAVDEFGGAEMADAGELEIRITDEDGASWSHHAFVEMKPVISVDENLL